MANPNAPYGFRLTGRTLEGGDPFLLPFSKPATEAVAFFPGDVLARADDNYATRTITPGTTRILGVCQDYGAASTATDHIVCVHPSAVYQGRADGSLVQADMGLNANFAKGTGDATRKYSKDVINSATEAVTATLDLHLIDKVNHPKNEWGEYVELVCIFNKSRFAQDSVGV